MVAILPGKHFALIAKELVTKHASPNASAQRTVSEAQKNIRLDGKKLRKPKAIAVTPVIKRPVVNIFLDPKNAI